MGKQTPTGYSASVRIWLRYGERMIPLSHSAATFVIPWEPTDLPAGDAEVVFTVDGTAYHRLVKLPAGMTRNDHMVTVSARDGYAPF